jgi:MSHA biogenesis protein MshG
MPHFQYKGRTTRGDAVEGRVEATSPDAVASQLLNSGITPIEINEARLQKNILGDVRAILATRKPKIEDLILFSRQMYSLTKAGVPLVRAIRGLADTTHNQVLARALREITDILEAGRDVSYSLGQYPKIFSHLYVSIIRVGESTGRLDEAFLQISLYLERDKETRDRIKQAIRYPSIVMVAIAVAIAIINLVVIPEFAKVFKGFRAELPWATKLLISTSDFTVNNWYYMLALLVIGFFGIQQYIQTENGRYRWDKWKLKIPIIGGIIHRALLSRFARSFSMASRAGVPLVQSLTVVSRAIDNEYVSDRIQSIRNGIERGDTLTRTAASTNMFTPLVLQMMAVGEETGAVDDMLEEAADYYDRELDYDLKNLSTAIEPVLLIAVGIMVFILALGVFLPMWDLAAAARGR